MAPTFLDYFGGKPKLHILEGQSLLPLLHGMQPADWRRYIFSEYDCAFDRARISLGIPVPDCRLTMVSDGRWKAIFTERMRTASSERSPRIRRPRRQRGLVQRQLADAFFAWARRPRSRITRSDKAIAAKDEARLHYDRNIETGILTGYWDEAELAEERVKRARYLTEKR